MIYSRIYVYHDIMAYSRCKAEITFEKSDDVATIFGYYKPYIQ